MSSAGITDLLFEHLPLLKHQAVRLGDDGHDIDDLAELLHDDDINWAERMTSGVDEEQTAVNTRVLDIAVTHGGKLLTEVGAVLVLDVFHDRVPAMHQCESNVRYSS
jgi:hypothetical protein